jgi:hypothetical protein
MSKLTKLSLIIGGYVLACFAAIGIVYVYQLFTQNTSAQASAGMYAFGDLLLFIAVFGVLALFPTGLAVYSFSSLGKDESENARRSIEGVV